MEIALLANANTLHTIRWANGLAEHDINLHLISLHPFSTDLSQRINKHRLTCPPPWGYIASCSQLRRLLDSIKPDVLNAHYASGYGTLATASGFRSRIISVWGSDVFDFPRKSPLHRRLVQKTLRSADLVCSISQVMADQCRTLCPELRGIEIVPWGVSVDRFRPFDDAPSRDEIVIGTVKVLAPKYGVDTLIQGFAETRSRLTKTNPEVARRLRLRIVGDGPQRRELERLSATLGIAEVTQFVGAVHHEHVPVELNKLDVYVAVSRLDSESFGVAIVEASACELPVVVSDAGGLPEVVVDQETGYVVPRENPTALAERLCELVADSDLRAKLGQAGRRRAQQAFQWQANVEQMIDVYRQVASTELLRQAA